MDKSFILALIFAVIIVLFALSNSERVIIDFVFTHVEISQALVIIISALLGATIVFFISLFRNFKLKQELKKSNKEATSLLEENESLKNIIKETEEKAIEVKEDENIPENEI